MNATPLAIPDVVLLEPKIYDDSRGHFYESYNARTFAAAVGHQISFVQDNHSLSRRGVVRGLHYQIAPAPQGKLVHASSRREIFDVAVEPFGKSSPTFGKWVSGINTRRAANRRQLWIPVGFAHCFMALSKAILEVLYKATDFYHRAAEQSIRWDDPTLAIDWPACKRAAGAVGKGTRSRRASRTPLYSSWKPWPLSPRGAAIILGPFSRPLPASLASALTTGLGPNFFEGECQVRLAEFCRAGRHCEVAALIAGDGRHRRVGTGSPHHRRPADTGSGKSRHCAGRRSIAISCRPRSICRSTCRRSATRRCCRAPASAGPPPAAARAYYAEQIEHRDTSKPENIPEPGRCACSTSSTAIRN